MILTSLQLQNIMPNCPAINVGEYSIELSRALEIGDLCTAYRAAAFLGQLAWESGDLKYWKELSSGERYEGRKDLGNVHPGDGPRYKGRGPIQLTGRHNYRAAGQALNRPLENKPDLVLAPRIGFEVAVWYWSSRKLNPYADTWDLQTITKKINGGLNHYSERVKRCNRALQVLCRTSQLL